MDLRIVAWLYFSVYSLLKVNNWKIIKLTKTDCLLAEISDILDSPCCLFSEVVIDDQILDNFRKLFIMIIVCIKKASNALRLCASSYFYLVVSWEITRGNDLNGKHDEWEFTELNTVWVRTILDGIFWIGVISWVGIFWLGIAWWESSGWQFCGWEFSLNN